MNKRILAGLMAVVLCSVGCSNKVMLGNQPYRTRGGMNVNIAQTGQWRGLPWQIYLEPWDRLNLPDGAELAEVHGEITQGKERDTSVALTLEAIGAPVGGDVAMANKIKSNARFVMVSVTNQSKFVEVMNSPANENIRLALFNNFGRRARVVNGVAVAYGFKSDEENSGKLKANATYKVVNGKLVLAGSEKTETELSDGFIYAYRMARVEWQKDANGKSIPMVQSLPDDN